MKNETRSHSVSDNLISSTSVCRGLRISGLDRKSTLILTNQIMKWVDKSGEEWTVNRLKTIKTFYLQKLANADPKPDWFSINRRGYPKYFSKVFQLRKPQKVLSALMCYTTFIARKPTKKQIDKFVSSATTEVTPIGPFILKGLSNPHGDKPLLQTDPYSMRENMDRSRSHYAWYGFWSPEQYAARNIRVPVAFGMYDPSDGYYKPELRSMKMGIATQGHTGTYHPAIRRWLGKQKDSPALADVWILTEINRMIGPVPYQDTYEYTFGFYPVGTIGFIQEPGYKLRAVANPYPSFQLALSRMGRRLKEELRKIPEDCTFNQDYGIRSIQEMLKTGVELSSIDLSDATNLFPYSITREVVSRVPYILKEDVELWDEVVKGTWLMPDRTPIRWSQGQPLGVYPSFYGFALSHHALVKSIQPEFYRILGDDIVIDRRSGDRLKDLYQLIGCKISEQKTINSSLMAEFAGKVIFPNRILIQPKFRSPSDRNFIDYVRNLGPRAVGFLQPRQRKVIKPFLEMPRNLHPYACGFNPKGKTYEQRALEAQPVLDRLEKGDDCEVFYTQLGAELATLSWAIQLRAEHPEIAQGLRYEFSLSQDEDSSEENCPRRDALSDLRSKVPLELQKLSKDELVWFIKASEAVEGRLPIYHWPSTADKLQKLYSNLIARIHFISGVTRVEQGSTIDKNLVTRAVVNEPSDPRGKTVLSILERKLSRLSIPKERNVNQSRNRGPHRGR